MKNRYRHEDEAEGKKSNSDKHEKARVAIAWDIRKKASQRVLLCPLLELYLNSN